MRKAQWVCLLAFALCCGLTLLGASRVLSSIEPLGVACACDCCTGLDPNVDCGLSGILDDYGQCQAGTKPCARLTDEWGRPYCACQCPKPPCQTCNGFPIP